MPPHVWPAMVLTAGLGTRLRPLTYARPKPAMPVAGEALVRRILRWLAACGVRDVVLNLHHLPGSIRAAVGDVGDLGLSVRYSHEEVVLGTAGGPRRALPLLGADRFFIVNGDTLAAVDLGALAAAHEASGVQVTMALVGNPDPGFYGGVVVDGHGSVTGFVPPGPANHGYHFIGTQMVEASVFAALPLDRPAETISQLYPRLIAERAGSVRAFHCDAPFQDIGTPADYLATSLRIARLEGRPALLEGVRCHVDRTARLTRTILWDDVAVGAGAELVDCIVGDHVSIPAGARFTRSAIVRSEGRDPGPGEANISQLLVARFTPRPAQEQDPADDIEAC
jgi:mannose-1-phosphate guanylyltransferase